MASTDPNTESSFWEAAVHFTPWFGRAVNHCPGDQANTHLVEMPDHTVWSVAKHEIQVGDELTGDYNEANEQFPNWFRAPIRLGTAEAL